MGVWWCYRGAATLNAAAMGLIYGTGVVSAWCSAVDGYWAAETDCEVLAVMCGAVVTIVDSSMVEGADDVSVVICEASGYADAPAGNVGTESGWGTEVVEIDRVSSRESNATVYACVLWVSTLDRSEWGVG